MKIIGMSNEQIMLQSNVAYLQMPVKYELNDGF